MAAEHLDEDAASERICEIIREQINPMFHETVLVTVIVRRAGASETNGEHLTICTNDPELAEVFQLESRLANSSLH
jgi:hypothetical protein